MHSTEDQPDASLHVIVAGYGPVGRAVAEQLERADADVTIVELNTTTIERQQQLRKVCVFGDVSDEDTLRRAGIERADALILTVPDEDRALRACEVARRLNPHIFIAARTNFLSKGLLATRAGADEVIVEEVVTAEAMKQAVLRRVLNEHQPQRPTE